MPSNNPQPFKRMEKTRNEKNFFAALKESSLDFNLVGSCVNIVNGLALSAVWPTHQIDPVCNIEKVH